MLETIERINGVVNDFVWGVPAMVCIIGVGLVLSFRTGFIQFRKFGYALKNTIGKIFQKQEAKEGAITPFQAVCTALAATIGRRCRRRPGGRPGSGILDVDFRTSRYVYQVFGGNAGRTFP